MKNQLQYSTEKSVFIALVPRGTPRLFSQCINSQIQIVLYFGLGFVAVLLLAVGLLLDNALLLAVRLVRVLGHLEYTSINPNGHKEG